MHDSGGAPPPSKPLRNIVEDNVRELLPLDDIPRTTKHWLSQKPDLAQWASALADEDLASLCERVKTDRVGLLAHLKTRGVTRLSDRQAIANLLGKDRREGFLWLPGDPPPTQALHT